MEPKVKKLKAEILKNYEVKIDDLLAICESPIEQLMLLWLLSHFSNWRVRNSPEDDEVTFDSIDFIIDEIEPELIGVPPEIKFGLTSEERRIKYNYRWKGVYYEKVVGFKVRSVVSESITVKVDTNVKYEPASSGTSSKLEFVRTELEIFPQREVEIDNSIYRIDIAILLHRIKGKEIIETRKIAVECDGHEFHSTKEQKQRDDKRTRALSANGWKVLRYSGSELNSINHEKDFLNLFTCNSQYLI